MPAKSRRRKGATSATGGPAVASTPDEGTPADVAGGLTGAHRSGGPQVRPKNGLDRYFEVSARRSTLTREVRGGFTTFFTMASFVVL